MAAPYQPSLPSTAPRPVLGQMGLWGEGLDSREIMALCAVAE